MTRIGIIGLGFMGRMHIGAYSKMPDARLVAVADQDAKRASGDFSGGWGNIAGAAESARHDGHHGHDRFSGADPQSRRGRRRHLRADAGARGAGDRGARGRASTCSARSRSRSTRVGPRIAEAAAQAKGLFMPAMCMRFWPQWAWLKQAVDEGRYGARPRRHIPARRVDAAGLVRKRPDVGRRPARPARPRHRLRLPSLRASRRRLQPRLHARRAAGPITSSPSTSTTAGRRSSARRAPGAWPTGSRSRCATRSTSSRPPPISTSAASTSSSSARTARPSRSISPAMATKLSSRYFVDCCPHGPRAQRS